MHDKSIQRRAFFSQDVVVTNVLVPARFATIDCHKPSQKSFCYHFGSSIMIFIAQQKAIFFW